MAVSKLAYYRSYLDNADILDDAQFGRLMKAIGVYGFRGEEPDFSDDRMLLLTWVNIRPSLDNDVSSKDSGARGGRGRRGGDEPSLSAPREPFCFRVPDTDSPPAGGGAAPEAAGTATAEAPDGQEKGAFAAESDQTLVLKTALPEPEKGALRLTKSDDDEDDDVYADADGEDDADAAPAVATVEAVGDFLDGRGLTLPLKDVRRIAASLAGRSLGVGFLDYALTYVSQKTYRARDGTGSVRFSDIPEGNRRGLYLDAVLGWTDMEQGYSLWLRKRGRNCGADAPRLAPSSCPECGGPLQVGGGNSACRACGGYVARKGGVWRIEPFPELSLSDGFRATLRAGA